MKMPDATPRLRLTEARVIRNWSQQEVADLVGTTHVNISRWERGITRPGPYFRRKLCTLFGKSEEELGLRPPSNLPWNERIETGHQGAKPVYDPTIPLRQAIPLVGRDEELARLRRRLCVGGSVALTALNGLPGVGKTALAIALAHDAEVRAYCRDGVLWAGLGPQPNIPGLLRRWGKLLELPATEMAELNSREAWGRAIRGAIGERAMLLVIDDAWHVEEALTFKLGGPHCAHLVTTRFPAIAAQVAADGATMVQELSEDESIVLLQLLAPDVVEREKKRATALVQAVGGLPLALTLMGNYLRQQSYGKHTRRIRAALERLNDTEERLHISEPLAPVEIHPSLPTSMALSLQSVLAVTDQQLSEQARSALYAFAIFPPKPNNFSEEAALAVAACSGETLDALSDTGLLESSGSDRYMLHQTVADYAHIHLSGDLFTVASDRLIAYVTRYVEAHKNNHEALEQESVIILAALESAHKLGRRTELVRVVNTFVPAFLLPRGLYPLAEQHVRRAYEAAIALEDSHGITNMLLYLGRIAQKRGNYVQAEAHFQQGLVLARQLGDHEATCSLLTDLGGMIWKHGAYAQAEAYLQEGLTLARQLAQPWRICTILDMLGSIACIRGDYSQSEAYLLEGLPLARQFGGRAQTCNILSSMGVAAGEQGNHIQAEGYFQEALVLARQIGRSELIISLLSNLGEAASSQGNYAQAEGCLQEALVLARQIDHYERISVLCLNLGLTIRKQGNYIQAEGYFQEGLALARQVAIPRITCNVLYEYGNLYLDQQQWEVAEAKFREMLIIVPEGDQDLLALAQYGLARVATAQGNLHEARRLAASSVTALEAMGHRHAQEVREWLDSVNSLRY